MNLSKITTTIILLITATIGAIASRRNSSEILYWKDGANYTPIVAEVSCKHGVGCTIQIPGHGHQQLYKLEDSGYASLAPNG